MSKKLDKLSHALAGVLKARGMQGRLSEFRIFGQWERTVGPGIASHAQPVCLRGTKLFLVVDSPAWMQQLSLLKPGIIEKVNAGLGRQAVKEIALNLGEIGHRASSAPAPRLRMELTAEDHARAERYVGGISDPDVRAALQRLIEKDLLRKKEKR